MENRQGFLVTVDNASSNDIAISYIMRRLRSWNSLVLDEKYYTWGVMLT